MTRILAKWIVGALAVLAAAYVVPGVFVASFYIALAVAFFLGAINLTLKPIFLVLTLPINILTLGLFTFVINGFFFWFLSTFIQGFSVSGFLSAIAGAFVVSVVNYIAGELFFDED